MCLHGALLPHNVGKGVLQTSKVCVEGAVGRFWFGYIMEVRRTSLTPSKATKGFGAQKKTRQSISNSGCKMFYEHHLSG